MARTIVQINMDIINFSFKEQFKFDDIYNKDCGEQIVQKIVGYNK